MLKLIVETGTRRISTFFYMNDGVLKHSKYVEIKRFFKADIKQIIFVPICYILIQVFRLSMRSSSQLFTSLFR